MPGEFVPSGYTRWLRTWVDDVKYTESMEFPLDVGPLHIEKAPDYAFDSPEEREQVAALLERYNHPASVEAAQTQPPPVPAPDPKSQDSTAGSNEQSASASGNPDEEAPEEVESSDEDEEEDFRDTSSCDRYSAKSKDGGDDRDNQKNQRPIKHAASSFSLLLGAMPPRQ